MSSPAADLFDIDFFIKELAEEDWAVLLQQVVDVLEQRLSAFSIHSLFVIRIFPEGI